MPRSPSWFQPSLSERAGRFGRGRFTTLYFPAKASRDHQTTTSAADREARRERIKTSRLKDRGDRKASWKQSRLQQQAHGACWNWTQNTHSPCLQCLLVHFLRDYLVKIHPNAKNNAYTRQKPAVIWVSLTRNAQLLRLETIFICQVDLVCSVWILSEDRFAPDDVLTNSKVKALL